MRFLLVVISIAVLSGCGGMVVKKCVGDLPDNAMHCPKKLKVESSIDLRKCEILKDACLTADPQ